MTSQQSYRSIRSKTIHPSFLHIFFETETGLLDTLLSNLCASEIYNLSVSLPGAGHDYFDEDLNSVLPRCRLRQHLYGKAKVQVHKAMSALQPEIWIPMQLAAKSFDERSVLFSGKLIEEVHLFQLYILKIFSHLQDQVSCRLCTVNAGHKIHEQTRTSM